MSKFFGWLKKNKQTDDTTQQPAPETNEGHAEETLIEENQDKGSPVEEAQVPETLIPENKVEDSQAEITQTETSESQQPAPVEVVEQVQSELAIENSLSEAAEVEQSVTETESETPEPEALQPQPKEKPSFFSRLKQGLAKTKANIGSGFANLFSGKKIDDELFEELETQLLMADLGVETTTNIIDKLTESAKRGDLKSADTLYPMLKEHMAELLESISKPLEISSDNSPSVILMVGVNGVGKTTTIGKMAKQFQSQGKKVMLAAGDTFRAAAVEQLKVWGERNQIPVVAQDTGSDSASVIFDALQSAKAKNIDILIADTAGRLQNKSHLMEELKKIVRVMQKIDPNAPHEIMLTIDAGTGQNAISQTSLFDEAIGLTGITLTKLDGTAKGGVIFALADKFSIPVRYIGIGEGIDDLRSFNGKDFVDALFDTKDD